MDYANGKIYSIRSYQTDDVYYGSTTQSLSKRLAFHKANYKHWQKTGKNKNTSFEILKYDDYYIELVENFACDCRNELEKREGQIIRSNDDAINKNIAGRTIKQYQIDNKDDIKQYRVGRKDNKKQYDKQYYINKQKVNFHQSIKTNILRSFPDTSNDFFEYLFKGL